MSNALSSIQGWLFQFDIDGLFYATFKLDVLSVQNWHHTVLKRMSVFLKVQENRYVLTCRICSPMMGH